MLILMRIVDGDADNDVFEFVLGDNDLRDKAFLKTVLGIGGRRPRTVQEALSRMSRGNGDTGTEDWTVHSETRYRHESRCRLERKEMFYLTTHSTHFIYGYMASHIW